MSAPLIANIVNATIGAASALFHLWHFFRRGRNVESLWALLISISASLYAVTIFHLYLGVPTSDLRIHFNILYLMISLFFWGLLGYTVSRAHLHWPAKWRWAAGFIAVTWISLIFLTPLLLGGDIIYIHLASTNFDFAQIKPGLGIALFYLFHGSLAVAALWIVNKHPIKGQTRPMLFNIAMIVFVLAATHDVLAIHQILKNVGFFLSEYSIALVALVMFVNSQEDSASLVDIQKRNLINSQHDFSVLMQSSRDIIAVHQQGIFVFINQAGVKFLGYEHESEIVGRPVLDFVHPEDQTMIRKRLASLEHSTSLPAMRERLLHKSGQILPAEISATQVIYKGQASTLVIGRDLGARIEFENRMMQMDRMVAIGTLAAGVAHEINNPLTFVVGNLELLEDDVEQLRELCKKSQKTRISTCHNNHPGSLTKWRSSQAKPPTARTAFAEPFRIFRLWPMITKPPNPCTSMSPRLSTARFA